MDVKWSLREPTTLASASYDGTVVLPTKSAQSASIVFYLHKLETNLFLLPSVMNDDSFYLNYIIDENKCAIRTKDSIFIPPIQ